MPAALSADQVRALRLRAQWLAQHPEPPGSENASERVAELAGHLVGVQAQYMAAARLALRARDDTRLLASDIEHARVVDRTLARTWLMRGTLHLVAAADLGWLLALFGPLNLAGDRRRRLELGLDDATASRGVEMLCAALAAHGPLTRAEIVERLTTQGVRLAGQARPHLIALAANQGILCHGPDRADGEPTFVLLDDWLPPRQPAVSPDAALGEVARRYVAAYGPAEPDDLAAWSGLPVSQARAAWQRIAGELTAGELTAVELEGRTLWLLADYATQLNEPSFATAPVVRLLPGYDPYLLGYRGRELLIAPAHARHLHPGGGVLHPALLVDGRVLGTWHTTPRRAGITLAVTPFAKLPDAVLPALRAEAAAVGRFLAQPASLRIEAPVG